MERKYRKLIVEIAHEITREDLETMRYLCTTPIQAQTQPEQGGLSLYLEVLGFFRALEKEGSLSCDNLDELYDWLETAERQDLAKKIEKFRSGAELSSSQSSGPASCQAVRPPTDEKKEPTEGNEK